MKPVVRRANEGVEEEIWVRRLGWSQGFLAHMAPAHPCLPRKQTWD